ncbi:MAG: hypothetical protein M0P71_14990 [Melioribacteraceae bacterium]|nr:hypothetical protein [Melioribacteraceae bacterium]
MKKYLPSIVSGFGAGVLQIVPILKGLACCLIVPAAAYAAVLLHKKSNHPTTKIDYKTGLVIGLLTGVFAALFGSSFEIIITFITKQNDVMGSFGQIQQMLSTLPITPALRQEVLDMIAGVNNDIAMYGFSTLYTVSIIMNNFIVNTIFGMVGGLVAVKIIDSKENRDME